MCSQWWTFLYWYRVITSHMMRKKEFSTIYSYKKKKKILYTFLWFYLMPVWKSILTGVNYNGFASLRNFFFFYDKKNFSRLRPFLSVPIFLFPIFLFFWNFSPNLRHYSTLIPIFHDIVIKYAFVFSMMNSLIINFKIKKFLKNIEI